MIQQVTRMLPGVEEGIAALRSVMSKMTGGGQSWSDILLHIHVSGLRMQEISPLIEVLRREYPQVRYAGMSVFTHVPVDIMDKADRDCGLSEFSVQPGHGDQGQSGILLSFEFFEKSHVEVVQFTVEDGRESEAVRYFHERMGSHPELAAVTVLPSGFTLQSSRLIEELSEGYEEIPFFGAMAGGNVVADFTTGEDLVYSFGPERVGLREVTLILYYGRELLVYLDYILGWEPIGKGMTATEGPRGRTGDGCVALLDGQPAVEVFRKYLGVTPNAFFVSNICEFPLVVERNGCLLGRIPYDYDRYGRIYLNGDIREGEQVRFSYGNHGDVLRSTSDGSNRMRSFAPESLHLSVCGNRVIFLGDEAGLEVAYYREFSPELLPYYGQFEIARRRGRGGTLNSAFVAMGLRETCPDCDFMPIPPVEHRHEHKEIIPLEERLATFLKAMTGELKEAAAAADAANQAKSAFLSNMSHEIRTPINAVLGMDEMILRESTEEPVREYAENIRVSGNTLLSLINDILDFSKIEAGRMEILPVDYQTASVLNDVVTMLQGRAQEKGLEIRLEIDETIPSLLHGDEIRLKQILTNILTNAVKYTKEGSVTLRIRELERTDGEYPAIRLRTEVEDTGIGIKEEDLQRLFTAFERIEEKRNRSIEGTGLGMSITSQLLSLMGSHLEVESTYGKGSVFSFDIIQGIVDATPIGNYEQALARSNRTRAVYHERFVAPDARILVVDDTPMNLTVIRGLLKKTELQVETAGSGAQAIHMVGENDYDVILLDHLMPEMDGIETLHELKRRYPDRLARVPIVCLTANAVSGAREQYIREGFDEYLTKPIDAERLESLLEKLLPADKIRKAPVKESSDGNGDEDVNPMTALPGFLAGIAAIRIAEGIRFCGSPDSYMEALRVWESAAEEQAAAIERAYAAGDWKDYTIHVHALKSTSRAIGAAALAEAALRMEEAGNAGDLDRIRQGTEPLLKALRALAGELAPVAADKDDDPPQEGLQPISSDMLKEGYEAIRELAGMFDMENVGQVIKSMLDYRLPAGERERMSKLRRAVQAADWDQVKELLK